MARFWFTFGYGQRLHAHTTTGAYGAAGIPLDDCFVTIDAPDAESARAEMMQRFGMVWCGQYAESPWRPGMPPMHDLTLLLPPHGHWREGYDTLIRDILQAYPDTADIVEWRDRAGKLGVLDPDGRLYAGDDDCG